MPLLKISKNDKHKIIEILNIKIKLKINSFEYNKKSLKNILSQIKKDKFNYLYLDWPFGSYVFDELLKSNNKNINYIKLSFFDIFQIENRFDLTKFFVRHKEECSNLINKYFKNKKIDGILVTMDWAPLHRNVVESFQKIGIPAICIIHEGVFQDRGKYYEGIVPKTDYTLVWGDILKSIFVERSYNIEKLTKIGSIKLNSYKYYAPKQNKSEFFKTLKLDPNKKTILYCCQLCDLQWGNQENALKKQREVIGDLVYIAKKYNYNLIIRNAPADPKKILPINIQQEFLKNNFVAIDGKEVSVTSQYLTTPGDSIYYSDVIVGLNTTMQLEASVLNKPALIAKYFEFNPKWNKELGLPVCNNKSELENTINKYIDCRHNLIAENLKEDFCKNYGFYEDLDYNPIQNTEQFLQNISKRNK